MAPRSRCTATSIQPIFELALPERAAFVVEASHLREHFEKSRDGKGQDRIENLEEIEQARDAVRSGPLQLFASFGYGPFAVVRKSDGERAGVCGLFKREILEYPDIGFALLPGYRGMGLAREASSAVVTHARDDLGLEEIAAIVSPENGPSIALIEKLGLSFAGMITMPGEDKEFCLYGMVLRP